MARTTRKLWREDPSTDASIGGRLRLVTCPDSSSHGTNNPRNYFGGNHSEGITLQERRASTDIAADQWGDEGFLPSIFTFDWATHDQWVANGSVHGSCPEYDVDGDGYGLDRFYDWREDEWEVECQHEGDGWQAELEERHWEQLHYDNSFHPDALDYVNARHWLASPWEYEVHDGPFDHWGAEDTISDLWIRGEDITKLVG